MTMKKMVTIVGARPQFVKAAAISRAVQARRDLLADVMIHTGQHSDPNMSDLFFQELSIPKPAYHLGIQGGGHGQMTGRMLEQIEKVLLQEKPDWVLVYGDTNSTLAGALAAAKLNIPIAHVEAGLRSFNRQMPEEVNRVLTDHLSAWLFCPTSASIDNLAAEGVTKGVFKVGDVMADAALYAGAYARQHSTILSRLGLTTGGYALATVHRAENTDSQEALARVVAYLDAFARQHGPVLLPLHPRTQKAAQAWGVVWGEGIRLCEPVGYMDMACLLSGCTQVLTDSGGVQKEAYFHRKPCITLREETEWVETVQAGWNRLWTQPDYLQPRRDIPDYGEGHAADRIVDILLGNS